MKRTLATLLALTALALSAAPALRAADANTKADTPAHISHGAEVNLADYIVPGKTTVFDFTSKYCPPCQRISPKLDALHAKRDDLVVVKVDINRPETKGIDWQSPVAQQYGLRSIPHFKIYGPDGKLVAEGDKAADMVHKWLDAK